MTNNSVSCAINNTLIWIDQVSDYVPVVSTITNLVDIFEKFAFTGCCNSNSIKSRYFSYVDDKHFMRCVVLLVPVLGNIIVGIYDAVQYEPNVTNSELPIEKSDGYKEVKGNDLPKNIVEIIAQNKPISDECKKIKGHDLPRINGEIIIENEPIFDTADSRDLIDQMLPPEVLKLVINNLSLKDVKSASLVSKYWGKSSLEAVKDQQSGILKEFIAFCSPKIFNQREILEFGKEINFSDCKNLFDIKDLLFRYRFRLILILSSSCTQWDFEFLESSTKVRPLFFEKIFEMSNLYSKFRFDSSLSYEQSKVIYEKLANLGAYDESFEVFNTCAIIYNDNAHDYYLCHSIILPLCDEGFWDNAHSKALFLKTDSYKSQICIKFFSEGRNNEGSFLAELIEPKIREEVLHSIPIMDLFREGKFKEAMELGGTRSYSKDLFYKHLEPRIQNLINSGKLDTATGQICLLMGDCIAPEYDGARVLKNIAMEFIKLKMFEKTIEISRLIGSGGNFSCLDIITALCVEKEFEVARQIQIVPGYPGDVAIDLAKNLILMYEAISENNFDAAYEHAILLGKYSHPSLDEACRLIREKMIEMGKVKNAEELEFRLQPLGPKNRDPWYS